MQYSTIISITSLLALAAAAPSRTINNAARAAAPIAAASTPETDIIDPKDLPVKSICNDMGENVTWGDADAAYYDFTHQGTASTLTCTDAKSCITLPGQFQNAHWAMCNDNNYGKCVTAQDLANRMWHNLVTCSPADVQGNHPDFTGQEFYADGTNIIVKHN